MRPLVITEDLKGKGAGPDRTWKSATDWISLARAVTAIGGEDVTLFIDQTERVTADLTIPANIMLQFAGQGRIQIAAGVTLTLPSPEHMIAGSREHIFECLTDMSLGDGLVAFTRVGTVSPAWWGAVGDGSTDDTAAIQRAIVAAGDNGTVSIPAGVYSISQIVVNNPVIIEGQGAVRNRWNSYSAAVTLLVDGSVDPGVLIGGTVDSIITEAAHYCVENVEFRNLLIRRGAGTGRGIVVDGSETILATRGFARDIRFHDVHVYGFADHNIEFVGNVFDVRFHKGSSRGCGATGVIATEALSYNSDYPGQIHFYDYYAAGNNTGPQWAADGPFVFHGGGIAYGSGFLMRSYAQIYGSHIEGGSAANSIGIEIAGICCRVVQAIITNFSVGVQIGDGTGVTCADYSLDLSISTATIGLKITAGGHRYGRADIGFYSCTTNVSDLRDATDAITGSVDLTLQHAYYAYPPSIGAWPQGARLRNAQVQEGAASEWLCLDSGSPGVWGATAMAPGAIAKTLNYNVTANDRGKRFSNRGAGAVIDFQLPDGQAGYSFRFVRDNASWAMHIVPAAGDSIGTGGAGKYLSLDDNDASVVIEYTTSDHWIITSASGTISHEP